MKTTQFKLNLPADVKAWLEEEAVRNLRSQGSQVVSCLRAAMSRQETLREGAEKLSLNQIQLIPTPELALLFGYNEPSASFYDFCRRTGIAPVPGRRGWYDPKLIRARLDAVQGISAAEREATTQPSLVAQRRARHAKK